MIYSDLPVKDCYLQMEGIVLPPIFSIIKGFQKRIYLDDLIFQGFLQKPAGCSVQKSWALSTMTPHHPNHPRQSIFCQSAPMKSSILAVSRNSIQVQPCQRLSTGVQMWIWGSLANPSSKKEHQMQNGLWDLVLGKRVWGISGLRHPRGMVGQRWGSAGRKLGKRNEVCCLE